MPKDHFINRLPAVLIPVLTMLLGFVLGLDGLGFRPSARRCRVGRGEGRYDGQDDD